MAGNTVATLALAKRAEVWSAELKEILRDELQGMKYVKWLDQFPDGDTFKIPSIGDATLSTFSLVTTSPTKQCRTCTTQMRSCLSSYHFRNVL